MVHHNVCPLCASENILLSFSCTDFFISKEVFGIYECTECSFKFTQDYPEQGQIGRYYESDDYISHNDTAKGFSNKLYRFVRNIMLVKKRGIINSVVKVKGNLLDIGSGSGHFVNKMKKGGWTVKGIEINKKAREYSISQFGLEIISPEQISVLEDGSFDCITLWHVLEHFHQPFQYISDITRLLKPGGFCLIALPNCSSFDAGYYGKFWAAYDVPRHIWHFTPATFRKFSEKNGLVIQSIMNLPLDVFYISILSEKYKGSVIPFISGTFKALHFAAMALFRKEKSSSVLYIIRKKSD
jgi:SAM-dependent methyltransferase